MYMKSIVIGVIEFVAVFLFRFFFDFAAKRQALHLRIRLFEALIQRVYYPLIDVRRLLNTAYIAFSRASRFSI